MRCYLVGFMGSGKTYWGRRLAERLDWPFVDLDVQIEQAVAKTIAEIFRHSGEDWFRQLEAEQLRLTAIYPDAVIATGGGTPCFAGNMAWMNANGHTIFLDTPAEVLTARLWPERDQRPLLQNLPEAELLPFVQEKLREREAFYRHAKVTLNTDANEEVFLGKMMAMPGIPR